MIKKLIIALVVAVILAGSGVAVAYHYSQTTQKKRQAENTAIQNQIADNSKKLKSLEQEQSKIKSNLGSLLAECQKGVVAYNALPAATKAKIAAPVCAAE
jgi:uncharacterized protein HemX